MKRYLIIVMLFSSSFILSAQRRIIHEPAPQPPTVPIDGGLAIVLLVGDCWPKERLINKTNKSYYV